MTNNEPIILMMPQRSEEWHAARKGVLTASACENILTPAMRKTFVNKTLAEILTGKSEPFFTNEYIEWGNKYEDEAREAYIDKTGNEVKEVGFVYKDDTKRIGCSPDGLVGDKGLIEIKCPMTKTHIGYLQDGPPKKYIAQMQFQMMCTGRTWCDFVSYLPEDAFDGDALDFPLELRLYICRVERDFDFINKLETCAKATIRAINDFLGDYDLTWGAK
jgi:putative phage-type endonuclease